MRIRGERRCQRCGHRWSYYETGSVECPSCGSLRSVGVEDERTLHTASPASLDLSEARNAVDEAPLRRVAELAAEACAEFVRGYGFVEAGELRPLDDTYLAAQELRHVAADAARTMRLDDDEEYYLLALLGGADEGERPAPDEVPATYRSARGLAYAAAVREYRSDLRAYLDEHPDTAVGESLDALGEHVKRVRALDGDVPPAVAETLVRVARELWRYLADGDEAALAAAQRRLADLRDRDVF